MPPGPGPWARRHFWICPAAILGCVCVYLCIYVYIYVYLFIYIQVGFAQTAALGVLVQSAGEQ